MQYVRPSKICELLDIDLETLHLLRLRGMPFLPLTQKRTRYNPAECIEWLRKNPAEMKSGAHLRNASEVAADD